MTRLGPFQGVLQPDPPVGPKRLRDWRWEACATLRIPRDWLSGVYVGKLTKQHGGWQSYVIFVVRDERRADFLFQCSDTTWQAYNRWPDQYALYDDGRTVWYWGNQVAVSFNWPYAKYCQILDAPLSTGSGEFFLWEFPLAFWLEQHGYDITYVSNLDTHADPRGLLGARGFLSVGHDEYWTLEMFQNLQAALQAGVSLGFFSGNTCCGRIGLSPDTQGERVELNIHTALEALCRMQEQARPKFRFVLHYGQVAIGGVSVGEEERISGSEVHFVFREEKLCGSLGEARLLSDAAWGRLSALVQAREVGRHTLSGLDGQFAFYAF